MGADEPKLGLTLADLKAKPEELSWDLEVVPGRSITIVYDSFVFTTEKLEKLNEEAAAVRRQQKDDPDSIPPGALRSICEFLSELLVSWDVLGDDGEPIPTTVEVLMRLPFAFTMEVVSRLQRVGEENPQNAEASSGSSTRRERRARSPRGSR